MLIPSTLLGQRGSKTIPLQKQINKIEVHIFSENPTKKQTLIPSSKIYKEHRKMKKLELTLHNSVVP